MEIIRPNNTNQRKEDSFFTFMFLHVIRSRNGAVLRIRKADGYHSYFTLFVVDIGSLDDLVYHCYLSVLRDQLKK